jgi:hypothetical protein
MLVKIKNVSILNSRHFAGVFRQFMSGVPQRKFSEILIFIFQKIMQVYIPLKPFGQVLGHNLTCSMVTMYHLLNSTGVHARDSKGFLNNATSNGSRLNRLNYNRAVLLK